MRGLGIGIMCALMLAVAVPAQADHRDVQVVMCRDVRNGDPVGSGAAFTGTDPKACVHVVLRDVRTSHVIRVEVSRPNGSIYRTWRMTTNQAPPGRYYPKYRMWWCVTIAGREPSFTLGQWGVKVLIDGQTVSATGFPILGLGVAETEKAQARLDALKGRVDGNPADAEARLDLADALIGLNQLDEAITQLQKALELDTKSAGAHGLLGFVYYRRGRWDDAERSFLDALHLDDDVASWHYYLALVYSEKGDKAKAIEHLRRVVQLAGSDTSLGKDAMDELAQLGATP